eukprot:Gb_40299 [translate_table: standard]
MLQGAAYYSTPVYGHSHYKKFWLKKMETEDDPCGGSDSHPDSGSGSGSGVLLRTKPSYSLNCSPLELKTGSPSSVRISPVKSVEDVNKRQGKYPTESSVKSELDYTLSLGVQVGDPPEYKGIEHKTESSDGCYSGEDAVNRRTSLKFLAPVNNSAQEEIQPSNNSPRAVTRICADCKTAKTPLWRNGPQGPKSLCNACGIRYKKLGKRPANNGGVPFEHPSSPPTPPISPTVKQFPKLLNKRKKEAGQLQESIMHQPRKKIKSSSGFEPGQMATPAMGSSYLMDSRSAQSEPDSPRGEESVMSSGGFEFNVVDENRTCDRGEALRRWRAVERVKRGLVRYGKIRSSMAKDEEEGALLLMALSCGVASC